MEKRKTKNFNWLEFGAAKVKIFIFVRKKKMMELYGKKKKKSIASSSSPSILDLVHFARLVSIPNCGSWTIEWQVQRHVPIGQVLTIPIKFRND